MSKLASIPFFSIAVIFFLGAELGFEDPGFKVPKVLRFSLFTCVA